LQISPSDLLGMLVAGDLDPILRSEFVAAVRSAANGDDAALARLLAFAESGEAQESSEDIDVPLYYATSCEEEAFPWSRAATPRQRIAEARARIAGVPAAAIAPFDAADVFALSDMPACAYWPFATPSPPTIAAPLPNVPTLIFSGADDLRTPTSGARAVAAQIPDAHLLVVPNTGHSVLGTEPTTCARQALYAFFAGHHIARCPAGPPNSLLRPTPLPPPRLAAVAPAPNHRGRAGRTLHAVRLTLADFSRQLLLSLLKALGSGGGLGSSPSLEVGGLRAGWAQLGDGALRFHGYTYIPGVSLSGFVKSESAQLRIGGSAAAHGILRLGAHRALIGTLGRQRVRIAASSSASGVSAVAARASADASAPPLSAPPKPASLRLLQRQLQRLPDPIGTEFTQLPELWAIRHYAEL
ncbi:MAG TPA: alpha/beta hydrolase, partial [Solirubrobacteraceae bacterium]|nr:alpha/beta hydrolase [Solirubrobacteraceae bacterium]